MNIKKSLLTVGAVSAIGAAGIGGSSLVAAQSTNSGSDSLVTKIAQKFNLKEDEVKAVFDEDRKTKESEQQTKVETELSQAVTDGKLTAAQKDAILAKRTELQTKRESNRDAMKDKTDAERKTTMESEKSELDAWATANGISSEYLRYVMGGHGGPGGPGGRPSEKTDN